MRIASLTSLAILLGLGLVASAAEGKPQPVADVARQIDEHIQKRLDAEKLTPSGRADDAEFLRRACLDITGKVPTAEKAAAFLDNTEPDKRAKLIDELLASPDFGRNFAIIWRTLVVKRDVDANRNLTMAGFQDWLAGRFNENPGWDKIVAEILTADGPTDKSPQGMFFLANRDMTRVDPAKITGAVSNLFLGVQMQCAECHNHPFVRQWKQTDFWGMAAFFGRTRDDAQAQKANRPATTGTITEVASKGGNQGKRPGGDGGFRGGAVPVGSIAIPSATVPGKTTGTAKAKFFEADEPTLDGAKPFRPIFSEWLTSAENKYFARAMVNRMWAHFFARGLVNPIDDMHEDNEPSHPELLTLLADEFAGSGFDLKHLIRCFANSQAYQRTSAPIAENKDDDKLFSHQTVKVMSAEVLFDSLTIALGVEPTGGGGGGVRGPAAGGRGGPVSGRDAFVRFFDTRDDDADATDSGHGIPQYLRLMNSAPFNRGGKLTTQIVQDKLTPEQGIEKLYLTVLARRPTPLEVAKLSAYLAKQPDPKKGYDGLLWVLVNSAEFICIR